MKNINEIQVKGFEIITNDSESEIKELEAKLAKLKSKEIVKKQREKKQYEVNRDKRVEKLVITSIKLHKAMLLFKKEVEIEMQNQSEALSNYGEMPSKSKGGFSIVNSEDTFKIKRTRDTSPTWDERSKKAVELIVDFLHDSVKKRAEPEFNLIMGFLEKNKAGDLEYQKVMQLLSNEQNYTDPRWKEGLRLLRESYKVVLKGYGYYFDRKLPDGTWDNISLNFSSISTLESNLKTE